MRKSNPDPSDFGSHDHASHHGGPHGRGFGGPPPWAFAGGFGPFGRGRGGPRARRGDTRAAALLLIEEQPRNGYQLMQEIEERTEGTWRPSPGAMYPALQQLGDEGLIEPDAGKLFTLTTAGKTYVEEHREELGKPWDDVNENTGLDARDLRKLLGQTHIALMQVLQAGTPKQIEAARLTIVEARKRLYQILSED